MINDYLFTSGIRIYFFFSKTSTVTEQSLIHLVPKSPELFPAVIPGTLETNAKIQVQG